MGKISWKKNTHEIKNARGKNWEKSIKCYKTNLKT